MQQTPPLVCTPGYCVTPTGKNANKGMVNLARHYTKEECEKACKRLKNGRIPELTGCVHKDIKGSRNGFRYRTCNVHRSPVAHGNGERGAHSCVYKPSDAQ